MFREFGALLVTGLLVAGCATAPDASQVDNAPIGEYPTKYQDIIKADFAQTLFDPYSAVYDFKISPTRGFAGNRIDGAKIGWITCGTVNAKNRLGGYVGAKPFLVVISNGSVILREIESFNAQRCITQGVS